MVDWLKQEGDAVRRGDHLCEVETDKATDQLESVAEGVLLRQMVPAGSDVGSGTVIAYIGAPGEAIPGELAIKPETPVQRPLQRPVQLPLQRPAMRRRPAEGEVRISLVLRNLAKREGVELAWIAGTGPGGKITRRGCLGRQESGSARRRVTRPRAALDKDQLAVARRVSRSNQEIPTVSLTASLDMSAAHAAAGTVGRRGRHEDFATIPSSFSPLPRRSSGFPALPPTSTAIRRYRPRRDRRVPGDQPSAKALHAGRPRRRAAEA